MINSILAGGAISLGGLVFLSYSGTDKFIASFLFSIGLICVLLFNLNLFTGKLAFKHNLKNPMHLVEVYIGNIIGCGIMSLITTHRIKLISNDLVLAKLEKPIMNIIGDGILCEICIIIAVLGWGMFKTEITRCLIVILGVVVFILTGAEHIIADMFYIFTAITVNINLLKDPRIYIFIIFVTLGNILGAVILHLLIKFRKALT